MSSMMMLHNRPLLPLFFAKGLTAFCGKWYGFKGRLLTRFAISWLKYSD
jgi:hypothetical protein